MARARIITSTGSKITIEGTAAEVKEIISTVKHAEDSFQKKVEVKERQRGEKKDTATDTILSLRESGFFNKAKNLLDVKRTLEEHGMIYPITTLSPILLNLVRKRLLGRIKVDKKWCYVKR